MSYVLAPELRVLACNVCVLCVPAGPEVRSDMEGTKASLPRYGVHA